jgi:hypothetical protein
MVMGLTKVLQAEPTEVVCMHEQQISSMKFRQQDPEGARRPEKMLFVKGIDYVTEEGDLTSDELIYLFR